MSNNNTMYNSRRNYSNNYESKLNVCEKDLLITQLKAQIFELEQNEKNFSLLTQKFKNLQNE